jgi:hypothetical protein
MPGQHQSVLVVFVSFCYGLVMLTVTSACLSSLTSHKPALTPQHFLWPEFDAAAGMASAASTNGNNGSTNGATPAAPAQASSGYKRPPKDILDIVDAPAQPALTFSPDRKLVRERCSIVLQQVVHAEAGVTA